MAYTRVQRKDGGFDFFDDKKKKIDVNQYVQATGANKNQLVNDMAKAGDGYSQSFMKIAEPTRRNLFAQDAQNQKAKSEVFSLGNILADLGKAGADLGKGIVGATQQGAGALADIATQGGAIIGRLGAETNPLVNQEQRDKNVQAYDQRLINPQSNTNQIRNLIQSQSDINGSKIVGTSDVDANAARIASGNGNLQDYLAVAGKSLDAATTATMFASPTAIAKGVAGNTGRQILNFAGKDALMYGGVDATAGFANNYAQTGDLGQALQQGATQGVVSGLTQGALDGIGYGLRKAPTAVANAPQTARDVATAVNNGRPSVIASQDPRVLEFDTSYNRMAQQFDQTPPDSPQRRVLSQQMADLKMQKLAQKRAIEREIGQGGYIRVPGKPDPELGLTPAQKKVYANEGQQKMLEADQRYMNDDTYDASTVRDNTKANIQTDLETQGVVTSQTPTNTKIPAAIEPVPLARNPQEAAGVAEVSGINEPRTPLEAPGTAKSSYANRTLQGSDQVAKETKKSLKDQGQQYQVETEAGRFTESAKKREAMGDQAFTKDVRNRLETKAGTVDSQTIADAQTAAAKADADGDFVTATEIYDKVSEHLTKAGQTIQAAAILARRSPEGMRFHAQKTLKKAGIELTPERQRALASHVAEVKKAQRTLDELNAKKASPAEIRVAEENVAIARENVQYYVATQIPSKTADKIVNFWRSGLLTAPTTTGGALLGNSETMLTRKLWTNPASAMADWTMSIFTGKRTQSLAKPGEFGKGAVEDGIKGGLGKQYWKTGRDAMMDGQKMGKYDQPIHKLNYGQKPLGKAIGGYVNGVYSVMGAVDKPFRYGAYRESLSSQARAAIDTMRLKGEKLSRADRAKLYDEMIENPTPEMKQRATNEALYETFQNKTIAGDLISNMKQWAKREGHSKTAALMDFVMPFTGVPSSIAARVIQRTPIGTANEIVKQLINVKKNGGAFDQRAMSRAIGEGTAGIPIIAAGAALAGTGAITGGYPRDEKTRKEWEQTGKQPNSIKIGDRWYSLNYLQPFGTLLAIGQSIGDSKLDEDSLQDIIVKGASTAANSVVSMSFLDGISNALSIVTEGASESSVGRFVGNTAASIIPNFVRSGARSADDIQRDTKGDNVIDTTIKSIAGALPGVRQTLPTKNDQFGQPLPAKDNFINQFLNPLRPSKVIGQEDPSVQELSRLLSVDSGVKPTGATKATFKDHELSESEQKELDQLAGPKMKAEYDKLIQSPEYASLSDEDKVKALKKVNSTVFGAVKAQWGYEKGYVTDEQLKDLDSNQRRYAQGNGVSYITQGIGDTKLDPNTGAYKFLNSKPDMTEDEKATWKTSKVADSDKGMIDALNGSLPEGLPKFEGDLATNEIAELYANYQKNKADKGWSDLQAKREGKKLFTEAYKSLLTDNEKYISSMSDKDIISATDNGDLTKQELDNIIGVDNILVQLGLTPLIGNKTRYALGYSGTGSSSGGKGGGKAKSFTAEIEKLASMNKLNTSTASNLLDLLSSTSSKRKTSTPKTQKVALKQISVKG